jgi:hypothetical protein
MVRGEWHRGCHWWWPTYALTCSEFDLELVSPDGGPWALVPNGKLEIKYLNWDSFRKQWEQHPVYWWPTTINHGVSDWNMMLAHDYTIVPPITEHFRSLDGYKGVVTVTVIRYTRRLARGASRHHGSPGRRSAGAPYVIQHSRGFPGGPPTGTLLWRGPTCRCTTEHAQSSCRLFSPVVEAGIGVWSRIRQQATRDQHPAHRLYRSRCRLYGGRRSDGATARDDRRRPLRMGGRVRSLPHRPGRLRYRSLRFCRRRHRATRPRSRIIGATIARCVEPRSPPGVEMTCGGRGTGMRSARRVQLRNVTTRGKATSRAVPPDRRLAPPQQQLTHPYRHRLDERVVRADVPLAEDLAVIRRTADPFVVPSVDAEDETHVGRLSIELTRASAGAEYVESDQMTTTESLDPR